MSVYSLQTTGDIAMKTCLMLMILSLLSGCSTMTDRSQVDWITPEGYEVYENGMDPSEKRSAGEQGVFDQSFRSFDAWVDEAAPSKADRDRAQLQLISLSDAVCEKHLAGIFGNNSSINFALDIATLAFSGASSIVKAKRPAQTYGGLATLAAGSRSAFNADLFYNLLAPAVIAKIRTYRMDLAAQMHTKRLTSAEAYSAAQSIYDALDYHNHCSLYVGIQGLIRDANKQTISDLPKLPEQMLDIVKAKKAMLEKQLSIIRSGIAVTSDPSQKAKLQADEQSLIAQQNATKSELYAACAAIGKKIKTDSSDCE
jgi:uncharacterized protein YceK